MVKDLKHLGFKTDKIKVNKDIDYGGKSRSLNVATGGAGGVDTLRVQGIWATWSGELARWDDDAASWSS